MGIFSKKKFDPRYSMEGYICEEPEFDGPSMSRINELPPFQFSGLEGKKDESTGDFSDADKFLRDEAKDSALADNDVLVENTGKEELAPEKEKDIFDEIAPEEEESLVGFGDEMTEEAFNKIFEERFPAPKEAPNKSFEDKDPVLEGASNKSYGNSDPVSEETSDDGDHANDSDGDDFGDFEKRIREVKENMDRTIHADANYGRQIALRYHFSYLNADGVRISSSKETKSAAYQASQDKNVVPKYHWVDTGEQLTPEEVDKYLP